jgi:ectoine hydroxylase-related dioxygenase (phytanoyl-CoA dioxygenase family)
VGSSFQEIKKNIDERVVPELTQTEVASGNRTLIFLKGQVKDTITPFLLQVASEASRRVNFPIRRAMVQGPALIIAPTNAGQSNSWTKGAIHRDYSPMRVSGVYSFMLFIDEVTTENGAIEFWKFSQYIELDERHPMRPLERCGLELELLVGPEGTVVIFDSRLLHRSVPNATNKLRLTLHWYVTGLDGPFLNQGECY